MEQLSLINIPALPTGLTAEVRAHNPAAPGSGAIASLFAVDALTPIAQPGLAVTSGGRLEAKAAAGLYDIKLGGSGVSPDTSWNGGAALWIYAVSLGSSPDPIQPSPQIVTVDIVIPAGSNALSVGPITIADNINVTVSAGSRWVIQ